jgi:lysophospholipase L1-like esterase
MRDWLKNRRKNLAIIGYCIVLVAGMIRLNKVGATQNEDLSTAFEIEAICRAIPEIDSLYSMLPFVNDSLCFINDPAQSLSDFARELTELLYGKDTVINIVHLGDSHIQAGYLSGRAMRLLHDAFGNAGRGWIAPFKLSSLNEPNDYYLKSNIRDWISGRCIQSTPKCPWGIGGIGIQTVAKDIHFNLIVTPTNGAGYSFNKVMMFRDCEALPMAPASVDQDSPSVLFTGYQRYENLAIDTFVTTHLIDTLHLKSLKNLPDSAIERRSDTNRYYGFMLTNGNPGVLYHSIGVNGAKYKDYTDRTYVRQLALLKPSLLIISLGANESFGRNFKQSVFEGEIDAFVRLVREELPGTTLLLTTPVESYRRIYKNKQRQYVRNENIAKVADAITNYTKKEGIACWDLFTIAGGDNSCKDWHAAKMFGRDRIHFSQNGYNEQGALLYKALIRSCIYGQNGANLMSIDAVANSDGKADDKTDARAGRTGDKADVKAGGKANLINKLSVDAVMDSTTETLKKNSWTTDELIRMAEEESGEEAQDVE